jgi:hypothetical protein
LILTIHFNMKRPPLTNPFKETLGLTMIIHHAPLFDTIEQAREWVSKNVDKGRVICEVSISQASGKVMVSTFGEVPKAPKPVKTKKP